MDVAALQAPRHTVEQPDHDERSCQGVVDGIARVTGPVAPPSLLRVRIRAYCSTCGYHDYPAQAEVPPACPFCDQPWREVEVRR
jgi:predicted Zn-ribbon and HTH transcriptional regulator